MPARLVALDEGSDIPLDRDPIRVGRHPKCDVRLPAIRVSRRHGGLAEVDGMVAVRDLGSSNGIRINGRKVEIGRLRPGDELSIANLRFRLEEERPTRECMAHVAEGSIKEGRSPADLPGDDLDDERSVVMAR